MAPGKLIKVNLVTNKSATWTTFKGNPVTPMSHLYTIGARVESAWWYRLREVVLRIRK